MWGCAALCSLAGSDDNCVAIVASGGLQRVYAAMDAHVSSADVQHHGCKALVNVAANNADNEVAIVASGGLLRVYTAMDAHVSSADVQRWGCGVLHNMSFSPAGEAAILAGRGVEVIHRAKAAHPHVPEVQTVADDALAWLA